MNRREFLGLGAVVGSVGLAGCTLGTSKESEVSDGFEIGLEPVVEGLTFPTDLRFLPNGDRLAAERTGQVLRHTDDGLQEEPFLDVSDRMAPVEAERGLVGLEIHPAFEQNRKLYVRYSGTLPESMADQDLSHIAVLSEFRATEDRSGVVPDSERRILEIPEPGATHNAGDLAFGPDGYLYLALGDGERTGSPENGGSWWHEQGERAQNTTDNLLGGILRIDVDNPEGDREYGIPSDNPLVGQEGRDEYYSWGLRNPYRMSFDGEDLYVGNVGEHTRESVYLTEAGANHGWPIFEGSSCAPSTAVGHSLSKNPANAFNPKTWQSLINRVSPVGVCPMPEDAEGPFTKPIAEYSRAGSRSITGGYVYRGEAVPELQGWYLFGDFIPPCPIFAVNPDSEDEPPKPISELRVTGTGNGRLSDSLLSFSRDPQGEVYVLTTGFAEGSGRVRRIVSPE